MSGWLIFAASGLLMVFAGTRDPEPSAPEALCTVLGGLILFACTYYAGVHFGLWDNPQ